MCTSALLPLITVQMVRTSLHVFKNISQTKFQKEEAEDQAGAGISLIREPQSNEDERAEPQKHESISPLIFFILT